MTQPIIQPERPQPVNTYRPDPVTPLENSTPQQAYAQKKTIFRAYQVIWYLLGLIEVLLGFRLLLLLLGANTASGFTDLIYTLSSPFAAPFRNVIGSMRIGSSTFEWSTVLAMIVYVIVAVGIIKLFLLVKPTDPTEVETTIDKQ